MKTFFFYFIVEYERFEVNELLFADDTALVLDSQEKLCRPTKAIEWIWYLKINKLSSMLASYQGPKDGKATKRVV